MIIRDAVALDFPRVLELNEEAVRFLSPLTPERLAFLHAAAAYHRVVEADGEVVAFLLALREGGSYDSPNYRWFAGEFERFLYIDRVVVSPACRGQGLGNRLYDDIFTFAAQTYSERLTCEFDVEPPNEASRRFHERYGFKEVGSQLVADGRKRVSLQAATLELENAP